MREPTPLHRSDRQPSPGAGWLTLAAREQLARDLADLPELVDQLHRHYRDLVSRGDRNPDDPQERYPVTLTVVDLADPRPKPTIREDPIWSSIGGRRGGVLPMLASWVALADGEMWDVDYAHLAPADPPTVTSEAGWLGRHLDWITQQQWVVELAAMIRTLASDLEIIVGPAYARPLPDERVLATAAELADILDRPSSTIRRWIAEGRIPPAGVIDRDGRRRQVYFVVDARNATSHLRERITAP